MNNLDLYSELQQIRARLEAIEHTQEVLVRAEAETILSQIWEIMDADDILARVYLLVDGKRTQKDIVEALTSQGIPGGSQPSVSRRLDILQQDLHLIEVIDHTRAGKVYKHTALERILSIARKLERRRANGVSKSR